jgi:hypothetical protein
MGELSVSLLRFGYLLVLWIFVLLALGVLRRDVYGTTITRRDAKKGALTSPRTSHRVEAPAEFAPVAAGRAAAGSPVRVSARNSDALTKVTVTNGALRGTTLPLARSGVVIGRSSGANVVLDDEFSSGRHAQIVPRGEDWYLEDLGSTNGTFLGREKITGPVRLKAGQTIRIGNTTLEVQK